MTTTDAARPTVLPLVFDEHGSTCLDGVWEFHPGVCAYADLPGDAGQPITVPALWEAQGHLGLDGWAYYRCSVDLDDTAGFWTLAFGAVMDLAEVYVNGTLVATHDSPFTPFTADVTEVLRPGRNEIAVGVYDPSLEDPLHIRMAHGKQGWANHHFPSRPSLYMTYGGIWQSVTLRRHGPLTLEDLFVNGDAEDLWVEVTVRNVSDIELAGRLGIRLVGQVHEQLIALAPRASRTLRVPMAPTQAARWSPEQPSLHVCGVDVHVDGELSQRATTRFGLRTVRVEGTRLLINDAPYRMKSVLVQGFRADVLYAEGTREQIEAEVRAAAEMGFNTLRLHIKAFHPTYLDVCDELGMLLECDLPVAEPIAHEEMGADTEMTARCVRAIREQVKRDRNHPSIILWSAMNELTLDREGSHYWDLYEEFARTLYAACVEADPTRPCIENEWVEPEPERVFCSPILTAHWYGRLHADYLAKIEQQCLDSRDVGKPLYVSEYGDWGLPEMRYLPEAPFWDTHDVYAAGLAASLWPSTVNRFVVETQRYQGLSDRLQTEVWRRHDHIGGYVLTELTDVPHELNGLLDLHRNPKPLAIREVLRANQTVLPMLALESLVLAAGMPLVAPLHVSNDGPALQRVQLEVSFGEQRWSLDLRDLPGHCATACDALQVEAPRVVGSHDLVLRLLSDGRLLGENRYPMHLVELRKVDCDVRVSDGSEELAQALAAVGASVGAAGPLFVGEGALTQELSDSLRHELDAGETVVILAQASSAGPDYPVPAELADVETVWGSTVFHFTTDAGSLPSLPRRSVLVAEDSTIQARSIVVRLAGQAWPDTPEVIAYKPPPHAVTGRIIGSHRVGSGRLIVCQYRLTKPSVRGDHAALAVLADLVHWAAAPRVRAEREVVTKDDGRQVTFYTWPESG